MTTTTFKVTIEPDHNTDLSWLGEFTDKTTAEHKCNKPHVHNSNDSRRFRYFCPSFGYGQTDWLAIMADNKWTTMDYHRAACQDRDTARDWSGVGVTVTMFDHAGRELAEHSRRGFDDNTLDLDGADSDVIDDLKSECLAEVAATIAKQLGMVA